MARSRTIYLSVDILQPIAMERHKISYLLLFAALSSNIVYVSSIFPSYKFEVHFVEEIVEENFPIHPDSQQCNALLKNNKISRVCRNVVGIVGRRYIGFLSNQPVEKVTLTARSTGRNGEKKYMTKSSCKCPTDVPIYITDGKSADSIMVILQERETRDSTEMTTQARNGNASLSPTSPIWKMLKSRRVQKKTLTNEYSNVDLGLYESTTSYEADDNENEGTDLEYSGILGGNTSIKTDE